MWTKTNKLLLAATFQQSFTSFAIFAESEQKYRLARKLDVLPKR